MAVSRAYTLIPRPWQPWREPDLSVDHPVGRQVLGALRGHPPQRVRGLHDRDRVPERVQVNFQVTAVRALGEPLGQFFYVVTGQVGVTSLAGQFEDGPRSQAAVQMIVQQHLWSCPDLGKCQHPTILLRSRDVLDNRGVVSEGNCLITDRYGTF